MILSTLSTESADAKVRDGYLSAEMARAAVNDLVDAQARLVATTARRNSAFRSVCPHLWALGVSMGVLLSDISSHGDRRWAILLNLLGCVVNAVAVVLHGRSLRHWRKESERQLKRVAQAEYEVAVLTGACDQGKRIA